MKILTITIILVLAQISVFARNVSDLETQIQNHRVRADSLQNLISQNERRITELAKTESEQLLRLNEMEKAIETGQNLIEIVEKQIDSLSVQRDLTAAALAQTQEALNSRREIMTMRLIQMYKMGEPTILSIILGASSPTEVVGRIRYMQDLNRYDRNLLDTIRQNERELLELSQIYEAENAHLLELLNERREENERVNSQVSERRTFLRQIRSERNRWETSRTEQITAQEELSKTIENLIAEIAKRVIEEEANFAEQRGRLPWAVNGRVTANFGRIVHPEYRTVIVNNGISIEAPNGTPIQAAAAGVVEFIGRMRGYGKLMIINHFGGFLTIYAHLDESRVERGARVRQGQVIATVGESGSLEGSKLHFEIRRDNVALDPLEWLVKR